MEDTLKESCLEELNDVWQILSHPTNVYVAIVKTARVEKSVLKCLS